jgi:hypothetical protein
MKTNDSATVKTAQRLDISGSVTMYYHCTSCILEISEFYVNILQIIIFVLTDPLQFYSRPFSFG